MRSRIRRSAHVLERIGLAMAGAAGGLFVGALVGAVTPVLTTQGFLLCMMLAGAVGFYLGIDTPPMPFHEADDEHSGEGAGGKIDAAEFLTAVGTFLATLAGFVSVIMIVLALEPHVAWIGTIMAGWTIGVLMQIGAGTIARMRA
jgi:hypothetical protein